MSAAAESSTVPVRFGHVNGEKTALLVGGTVGEGADEKLVFALPWDESVHSGSWQKFEVENSAPDAVLQRVPIRITTIPVNMRMGIRKTPLHNGLLIDFE